MGAGARVVLVAALAALAGAAASLYFEPQVALRLAGTEAGQRVLQALYRVQAPPPPAGTPRAQVGAPVPAFRLATLDGRATLLPAAWAGRTVLVNLWATWCPPCLKELPELQAYARAQGRDGVLVAGIALDDPAAVRAFAGAHPINYQHWGDTPGPADAGVILGNPAGMLPYSVLIGPDGRLLRTRLGPFRDGEDIRAWVAAAAAPAVSAR